MKVLIVAKTRRGAGACVGGITQDGRSVRLVAADAASNERAGLGYEVGDVWEIDWMPDYEIVPPHVENIVVLHGERLRRSEKLVETIHRFMPPVSGGVELLFDGLMQSTPPGSLFVADTSGLPKRSTMFWIPDQPLKLDFEGKRIRYRYPTPDGGRTLTFVGFQEPVEEIPAGTLLRVSLAHRWRPEDKPEEEMRCFVQLSGWFDLDESKCPHPQPLPPAAKVLEVSRPFKHSNVAARGDTRAPEISEGVGRAAAPAEAHRMLKQVFGYSTFLPVQEQVITRVLARKDTLVVMPTGGGKSLCYQLPAQLFQGLTVVVSPLVALMHDQVQQLRQLNVAAASLNHMVQHQDYTAIMDRARQGRIKILYLAPETLLRPESLLLLEQSNLACLAIDEAHCISEWGHDFRPEYRQLHALRRRFPEAVCVALTATATPRVREDIRKTLHINPDGEFVASFNRPNLSLRVAPRKDGLTQILQFLEPRKGQCGIIYCGTRQQTDELAQDLTKHGWPALPYHAGLDGATRNENQRRFSHDEAPLIVATVAFGMGINKSNVRFVIHSHLPKDIESYYQEIGRAGRDGMASECLLLYNRGDAVVHRHFIDEGALSERAGRSARLQALMRFAEARECRRGPLLAYFGEDFHGHCGNCDNCAEPTQDDRPLTDLTGEAIKVLQCVVATGEVFGQGHIISILRGSRAEKVLARKHDRLTVYGTGKELSSDRWRDLIQALIQAGVLNQNLEFGGLELSAKGQAVLEGKENVMLAIEQSLPPEPLQTEPQTKEGTYDGRLFDDLRALRRQLAFEQGLPPYMIFSDRALTEMATYKPKDETQFLDINGVGEAKLEKYGEAFLSRIRGYVSFHPPT